MDKMILILIGIAVVGLIVYLIIHYEKKRRQGLQEKAQMLGYTFTQKAGMKVIGKAIELHLFNIGHI